MQRLQKHTSHLRLIQPHILSPILKRHFFLHEYQAFELLKSYQIPVPAQTVANNPDEALRVARSYGRNYKKNFIIKAQVKPFNQQVDDGFFISNQVKVGLVSGIQTAQTPEEVRDVAEKMLGHRYLSKSTPARGLMCKKVLIMEEIRVRNKFFLHLSIDSKEATPVLTYSNKGGIPGEQLR